jgi:hypothetical protein
MLVSLRYSEFTEVYTLCETDLAPIIQPSCAVAPLVRNPHQGCNARSKNVIGSFLDGAHILRSQLGIP